MLDERCLHLLNVLNNECNGSGYKVFEITDLAATFSNHFNMDNEGVRQCINILAEREYISVKYEDEREICAMPLTKGRFLAEKKLDEEIVQYKEKRLYFLYSFIGAVSGSVLAFVLGIIVYLLVK